THQYRTFLAQVRNLTFGNHTIKVINRGSSTSTTSVLDIDAFVVETRGRGDVLSVNGATVASGNKTVDLPLLMFDDSQTQAGNNKVTWSEGWEDDSVSLPNKGFLNARDQQKGLYCDIRLLRRGHPSHWWYWTQQYPVYCSTRQ
ncbi:6442_t:CDS:2, partial [Acaulospora colombiana]